MAAELSKRFHLPLNKKARDLSGGNRVKLSLVAALSHAPRLLLLDEPTAGLDPVVRSEVLETLFELFSDGTRAIFYSTHILSDISRLVDELAFLHEGVMLKRAAKEDLTEKWAKLAFSSSKTIKQAKGLVEIQKAGDNYQAVSEDGEKSVAALRSLGVTQWTKTRMSIEEIAVHILKGAVNGAAEPEVQ
jgi:ABC-2 type transport system ATP-binding protein